MKELKSISSKFKVLKDDLVSVRVFAPFSFVLYTEPYYFFAVTLRMFRLIFSCTFLLSRTVIGLFAT
jgi:hypothetical protein